MYASNLRSDERIDATGMSSDSETGDRDGMGLRRRMRWLTDIVRRISAKRVRVVRNACILIRGGIVSKRNRIRTMGMMSMRMGRTHHGIEEATQSCFGTMAGLTSPAHPCLPAYG